MDDDYVGAAKAVAIDIFDQYLRKESKNEVEVDDKIKIQVFMKFGCEYKQSENESFYMEDDPSLSKFNTDLINEEILIQNLNQYLFHEIYT